MNWKISEPNPAQTPVLAQRLNISRITAQLLINRGITTPDQARRFLQPDLNTLIDPFRMDGMRTAVERLDHAIRYKEPIAIFGDYDVDGLTGTAVLTRFLRLMGGEVMYYIPHRVEEGYSLSAQAVKKLRDDGAKVLITVDCGTSDVDEIALARSLGMDVIVVDHHEPPARLPEALCLLNPKRPGSNYPHHGLCAAGVAFKLAWAMADALAGPRKLTNEFKNYLMNAMAFAAVGTIADVSPLTDENRVLVAHGLHALKYADSVGFRALMKRTGLSDDKPNVGRIAFRLAPWLNAGGRVGTARLGEDLLTTDDPEAAERMVDTLEAANRERQAIEAKIFEQAVEAIENNGTLKAGPALVLADDRWHIGVVGIVAARLVEKYTKPTVLIAMDGDTGRGSARSISGFPLHEAIERGKSRGVLIEGGGHAMAGGLTIHRDNISLFAELLNEFAEQKLTPEDRVAKLRIDAEVALPSLTREVVREIEMLAPFGPSNPTPILMSRNVRVAGTPRLVGRDNNHLQLHLTQDSTTLKAICFGRPELRALILDRPGMPCSIAFEPTINTWQGRENVELILKDLKFE